MTASTVHLAARRRTSARRLDPAWPWTTAIVAVVSLWLPFANYGFAGEFIGGDANVAWAFPAELVRQLAGVFLYHPGLGANAAEGIQGIFPTLAVAAGLHATGLSTAIVARLMIALYFFVAILGAERLGRELLSGEDAWVQRTAALGGGLLYGINNYTVHVFSSVETYFPLGYIALPWLLYGVLLACERDRRAGVALVAAGLVVAGGVAVNPAFYGLALLVLPIAAALVLAGGASPRRVLAVCVGGLALGIGLSAWWVLPAPTGFGAGFGQLVTEGSNSWVQWMSGRSGFPELFRLDGYVGGALMPHGAWYSSPFGSLLGYVPLLVGVAGIGIVRPRLGSAAMLLLLALAFLAKGVHAPLEGVYQALMDHVPGFSIFRSPYDKWAQLEALMLVVVYVLGFAGLMRRIRASRWNGVATVVVAVCATLPLVLYPWPAFAGQMLLSSSDPPVSFTTAIPDDYRRVAAFLRGVSGPSRTMVLRIGGLPYAFYKWGYFGEDPLPVASGVPMAGVETIPRAPILSARALERALDAMSVRYLVVHDDLVNAAPGPDVKTLERAGDARLVLWTVDLRVFERRGGARPLVSLVHRAALIAGRSSHPDELAFDATQTSQLVPNVGPQVADRGGPVAVLARPTGANQLADSALGRVAELSAAAGPFNSAGAILGNPLVATAKTGSCGSHERLDLVPVSTWRVGAVWLPAFDVAFCLAHPRLGAPFVDGVAATSDQIAFDSRPVHRLDVLETVRHVRVRAVRQLDDGLVFHFLAPFSGDKFVARVPQSLAHRDVQAKVLGSDDAPFGAGFPQEGATSMLIPSVARRPLPGELCFIDFHESDPRRWPAIRALRAIDVAVTASVFEHVRFSVPRGALEASTIPVRPPLAMRERVNAPQGGAHPAIAWSADRAVPSRSWKAAGDALDIRAARRAVEVRAQGVLLPTDRYRLRVNYRARGDATLEFLFGGYNAPRRLNIKQDGQPHAAELVVYPPTGVTGTFAIVARATSGELHLTSVRLDASGPNALLYGLSAAAFGGSLLDARQRAPWWFEATVRDCNPCLVQLAASEPRHWLISGGRVLGAYVGSGQSTGFPWSGVVTGASTWLVNAGPGVHMLRILFFPALLAGAGLIVSLAALIAGILVLRRVTRGPVPMRDLPRSSSGTATRALRVASTVLVVALTAAGALPRFGDVAGTALWVALVLLALSVWAAPSPRPALPDTASGQKA